MLQEEEEELERQETGKKKMQRDQQQQQQQQRGQQQHRPHPRRLPLPPPPPTSLLLQAPRTPPARLALGLIASASPTITASATLPAVAATPFSTTSNAVVTALFRNVLTGPGRSRNTVSSSLLANEPASTPGTSVTRIECVSAPRGVVVRCLIRRETASVQYDQSRRKA